MNDSSFAVLGRRSLAAILICAALVAICYFVVDRPVAYYVHEHKISRLPGLRLLTYPPPVVQAWSPALIAVLVVRRAFGPFRRWQLVLLAASVSMILADQFRESLAVVFGRYWPETWIDNNPSLIGSGAYGFHPFHEGSWYGSFRSGHLARTVGVASVFWIAWPRSRGICAVVTLAIAIGMIGMNYHFVGDVIAGAFVGGIVGTFVWTFCAPGDSPGAN